MTRASTDSDRYFTPQELLDLVLAQWGSIDLDPCWDPESRVKAKKTFDIRTVDRISLAVERVLVRREVLVTRRLQRRLLLL